VIADCDDLKLSLSFLNGRVSSGLLNGLRSNLSAITSLHKNGCFSGPLTADLLSLLAVRNDMVHCRAQRSRSWADANAGAIGRGGCIQEDLNHGTISKKEGPHREEGTPGDRNRRCPDYHIHD
jgi:hypothetical protein